MFSTLFTRLKNFFIRFFYGSKLTLLSLTAYAHYKKLLLLPIIAALIYTVFLAVFLGIFVVVQNITNDSQTLNYGFGALGGVLFVFSIWVTRVFIGMVATYMLDQYCEQNFASLSTAFIKSFKKIRIVLMWASLSTIVRLISSRDESAVSSSLNIWQFIAGTSWSYLSFFMYPIVAFEEKNIWNALRQSAMLMKKYFGSVSGSLFSFRILFKLMLLLMVGFFSLLYVFPWVFEKIGFKHIFDAISVWYLLALLVIYTSIVFYSLITFIFVTEAIVSTILYRFVHNMPIGIFDRAALEAATKER